MTTTPQFTIKLEIQWKQNIVRQIFFFFSLLNFMLWKIKFQHSFFAATFTSFLRRLVLTASQNWAGQALRIPGIFVVQGPNVKPVLFINTFQHKRTTTIQSCISNFLSSKFFHLYLCFCKFSVPCSSCRCVQLCKMLWTCIVWCSQYLRQKAPTNPQSFLTSDSTFTCELPSSSITHLPHPPQCLFPPSELFRMLQHPPFPNCSTYALEHPSTTLPPFPFHLLPLQGSSSALPPPEMFFMGTEERSSFGCWGWWVGLSRGNLDASRQGPRVPAAGLPGAPEPAGMKCGCTKSQSELSLGTHSSRTPRSRWEKWDSPCQSSLSHWIKSDKMWPAFFSFFLLSCF